MLDARQLRYFIAVAEELSFAGAADRLNVAQSAVSQQIKGLEEAFGARLLNRRKRAGVSLTEVGRLFLSEAVAAIRQLERAEQVGHLAARGELGQIEVVAGPTITCWPSTTSGLGKRSKSPSSIMV